MHEVTAKTILNRKKQRDPWFLDDYTLNPFSGCSFNCLYCYIRGSKYGLHMERQMSVKSNAEELLEKALALRARKGQYGVVVLASATDPYVHLEEETQLTRHLLKILAKYRFPVHLITKSPRVLRDLDILKTIDATAMLPEDLKQPLGRGAMITFSFATVDEALANIFEPGAPMPQERLETMKACAEQGMLTGVSMMPLLPWLSDTATHLDLMFNQFKQHGAHYVMPADLTLFGTEQTSSKTLVFRAVKKHFPELLPKYEKLFAQGSNLPAYYRKAFYEKMETLGKAYGLRDKIITFENRE